MNKGKAMKTSKYALGKTNGKTATDIYMKGKAKIQERVKCKNCEYLGGDQLIKHFESKHEPIAPSKGKCHCQKNCKEPCNENWEHNEACIKASVAMPEVVPSTKGDWEDKLKLYLTSAGDRRRTIHFIKELLASQTHDNEILVKEWEDGKIKCSHCKKVHKHNYLPYNE